MDQKEIWRSNLRLLASTCAKKKDAADKLGIDPTRLNHMIGPNPIRNVTADTARLAEDVFKVPRYWMDTLQSISSLPIEFDAYSGIGSFKVYRGEEQSMISHAREMASECPPPDMAEQQTAAENWQEDRIHYPEDCTKPTGTLATDTQDDPLMSARIGMLDSWRNRVSDRSMAIIERLKMAAESGKLTEEDLIALDVLARRLEDKKS